MIKAIETNIIYQNPIPMVRSIQSTFPNLCTTCGGKIIAAHVLGEAFEAADGTTYISVSTDGGKTFNLGGRIFDKKNKLPYPSSDTFKITHLGGGKLIALGYAFKRTLNEGLSNPKTGGIADSDIFACFSDDEGETWSHPKLITSAFGSHVEASAPVTVLKNGDFVSPVTNFPDWEGKLTHKQCGRLLRSTDYGGSWQSDTVCMDFDNDITCYEQRLCRLEKSGAVVVIGWNENAKTGERLANHYTISYDNGHTFSKPYSTGIMGQSSGLCAVKDDTLFAVHSLRRDTDSPGIYGYIVDLSGGIWDIKEEIQLWSPACGNKKVEGLAEIFSFVRFGQPSACKVSQTEFLMSFWAEEYGQYRTYCQKVEIKL